MAVTAYTGPPGAGKSYALCSQVILPAIIQGRRVLTNVAGVKPDAFVTEALVRGSEDPGELVTFEGNDALLPGFWPTKDRPDAAFVKPGDLVVFDEWRLTFSNRGPVGNPALEPFLRWHRHLVGPTGEACDVVIGSQLITDIHRDFRGLVERSYKFRKLSSVGMAKAYVYDVYEGHEQRKGSAFRTGNGRFDKSIFALYQSYDTEGEANEKPTDGRATLFSRPFQIGALVSVLLVLGGGYKAYQAFFGSAPVAGSPAASPSFAPAPQGGYLPPLSQSQRSSSTWRIAGQAVLPDGTFVVLSDGASTRVVHGRDFVFENGRPISGFVDGEKVYASDRLALDPPTNSPALLPGQLGGASNAAAGY